MVPVLSCVVVCGGVGVGRGVVGGVAIGGMVVVVVV